MPKEAQSIKVKDLKIQKEQREDPQKLKEKLILRLESRATKSIFHTETFIKRCISKQLSRCWLSLRIEGLLSP